MDELNFMNFITKNLDEIISLFLAEKSGNQNDLINDEILQALNFILEGSIDNLQTILSFSAMLKQPIVQSKLVSLISLFLAHLNSMVCLQSLNSFLQTDGKVYVKNIIAFLKNYLEINPFGLNNCLRSGKRIFPSHLGGSVDPRKAGKMVRY